MKKKAADIYKKIEAVYKPDEVHIKNKRTAAFKRLGEQLWKLYQDKVFDRVFDREDVQEIIREINGYEKAVRLKSDERKTMCRNAVANLRNKDSRIKKAAIRILDKLEDREAIPHLAELLRDNDDTIRTQAAALMHKLVNVAETRNKNKE